jgi:hypothetical protein
VKLELLKSAFLGSLVLGSLAAGSLAANANSASKTTLSHFGLSHFGLNHFGVISSTEFYDLVKQTKPNQVATNFGNPDEMITLKNAAGQAEGVVWVYHKAVLAQKSLHDARFVLINGEMKYVTLSGAA